MNTRKETILQICLLKLLTAEVLRNVPNITNLISNQHSSTENHLMVFLRSRRDKYHCVPLPESAAKLNSWRSFQTWDGRYWWRKNDMTLYKILAAFPPSSHYSLNDMDFDLWWEACTVAHFQVSTIDSSRKKTACLMATLNPNLSNYKHEYRMRWCSISPVFYGKSQRWRGPKRLGVTGLSFKQPPGESALMSFPQSRMCPRLHRLGNLIWQQSWSKFTSQGCAYNSQSTNPMDRHQDSSTWIYNKDH